MNNTFELAFDVRDYELDMQGIVNNAVYHHYFEHCRHSYLKTIGYDFAQLYHDGINAVVVSSHVTYKKPLKSGDRFICQLNTQAEGRLKIVFHQSILLLPHMDLVTQGIFTVACIQHGKPIEPMVLKQKMGLM
jgi:acyl-CoA thioester hydrolase